MDDLTRVLAAYRYSAGQLARNTYLQAVHYLGTISPNLEVHLNNVPLIDTEKRNWDPLQIAQDNDPGIARLVSYKGVGLYISAKPELITLTFPTVNYYGYNCDTREHAGQWDDLYKSYETVAIEAGRWPTLRELRDEGILWMYDKSCCAKANWYSDMTTATTFLTTLEDAYRRYTLALNQTLDAYKPVIEAKAVRFYIAKRGELMYQLYNESRAEDNQVKVPDLPVIPKPIKTKIDEPKPSRR